MEVFPRRGAAKPACAVSADAPHHSPGTGTTGHWQKASSRGGKRSLDERQDGSLPATPAVQLADGPQLGFPRTSLPSRRHWDGCRGGGPPQEPSQGQSCAPVQSPLPAGRMRPQPPGGDGAIEVTFRSGGSMSRQPCCGRLSEEAIRSVRCLRCHYACDACLYTQLIINGGPCCCQGGHSQAHPAPVAPCSGCCQKRVSQRSTAFPAAAPAACGTAVRQPSEQGIPHPTEELCHQPGTNTHIHNNASLFSPADFVPFFSSPSLLLALPYAKRSK